MDGPFGSKNQVLTYNFFFKLQERFYEKMEEELDKKVNPALDCLLPDDTKTCIIEFGSQIIRKRVKKNAKQYIKSNFSRGK